MRCIYMPYISVAKFNIFYYNHTFLSFGNIMLWKERRERKLSDSETHSPLYTCLSSFFLSPPIHHSFLKRIAKKKFLKCRLIPNSTSVPVN